MKERIEGAAWVFGDDVNTDVIFPGKYTYSVQDPEQMAQYAMEDADPDFAAKVQPDDVVVAGKNFGCGSSREQAVTCLKMVGVGAVVARSFARIYFRNAINQGLPIVQCPELVEAVKPGDRVVIRFLDGVAEHGGRDYRFPPLPPEVMEILEAGGLVEHVKNKLKKGA